VSKFTVARQREKRRGKYLGFLDHLEQEVVEEEEVL
jgi:hypothetical protein